jgi:uncharacterized protein YecE (DUF72 family)
LNSGRWRMTEPDYFFGTAGWGYDDWYGTVYPAAVPRGFNHLQFLSQTMDFVEVNTSFYRIPSEKLTAGWVTRTASIDDFQFWIKVHQNFTHQRQAARQQISEFKKALAPLVQASKLAGLLAQFPYSFKLNTGDLNYVLALAEIFREYPLAIEFRHNSWNRRELFELFTEKQLIWVNIDQPPVSLSLPLTAVMTHPHLSYFRLHGRNEKTWFSNEGRDARYDYDYSLLEINQIAAKIKELAALAKKVFISGNNHYKGSAYKNLLELKKSLKSPKKIPSTREEKGAASR